MAIKAALIDLDGTLIDTRPIEALRTSRNWRSCVSNMHKTKTFDGVTSLLTNLSSRSVKIAIVTTSVSYYALAMLKHHNLHYDQLIAYHDAKPKPAPDSFQLALNRFGISCDESIGLGDGSPDLFGLQAAGIVAVGAGWSPSLYIGDAWDQVIQTPAEFLNLF